MLPGASSDPRQKRTKYSQNSSPHTTVMKWMERRISKARGSRTYRVDDLADAPGDLRSRLRAAGPGSHHDLAIGCPERNVGGGQRALRHHEIHAGMEKAEPRPGRRHHQWFARRLEISDEEPEHPLSAAFDLQIRAGQGRPTPDDGVEKEPPLDE